MPLAPFTPNPIAVIPPVGKGHAEAAAALLDFAATHEERSRLKRCVGPAEAQELLDLLNPEAVRIRVYSLAGFVANSYSWRAPIEWFEATRKPDSEDWTVVLGQGDAKRSGGNAPRVVEIGGRRN